MTGVQPLEQMLSSLIETAQSQTQTSRQRTFLLVNTARGKNNLEQLQLMPVMIHR